MGTTLVGRTCGEMFQHLEDQQEKRLDTRAEISEPQARAMIALYREWCESEGVAFNEEHFCEALMLSFGEGNLVPLVLWDGDEPVGVVMANIYRELFTGDLTAMGGQLYLKPAYRGHTEGAKLGIQLIRLMEWFGCKHIRIPAMPELAQYYWRHFPPGFKLSTLVFSTTKE